MNVVGVSFRHPSSRIEKLAWGDMEYYSLIVVFTVLFDFSSCACGGRHFGVNVALGNHGGNEVQACFRYFHSCFGINVLENCFDIEFLQKFEEKPSTLRNLDVSNHHRSSTNTLLRSHNTLLRSQST